jgi:hypothetical protein
MNSSAKTAVIGDMKNRREIFLKTGTVIGLGAIASILPSQIGLSAASASTKVTKKISKVRAEAKTGNFLGRTAQTQFGPRPDHQGDNTDLSNWHLPRQGNQLAGHSHVGARSDAGPVVKYPRYWWGFLHFTGFLHFVGFGLGKGQTQVKGSQSIGLRAP